MADPVARTANLLGAVALTCADRLLAAAVEAAGTSTSGAAALLTLSTEPGIGVTELGGRVGLSQSAAARMVDALTARGLATRRPESGRSVGVELTPSGRAAARDVLQARGSELGPLVDGLDVDEREALTRGLEKLLDSLFDGVGSEHLLCRLCDRAACRAGGAPCPVGQAARTRRAD